MAPQTKRTPFRPRKSRWLRPSDLPFSPGHVYRLILEGILFSVELRVPGFSRSIRVIDGESLDRYLLKLGREQRAAHLNKKEASLEDAGENRCPPIPRE